MAALKIQLPHGGWRPRKAQRSIWSFLQRGGRRGIAIAHRRFGKDEIALHAGACAAHTRVADYWHCLPQYAQARKAIWTAVNPHTGRRRIDEAFPHALRASTNEQEMYIRFKNGSGWRVVGSDNPDSLVGTAPAGIVFSEWALANPSAWAYLAPILEENDGWGFFITTPRGRNHAHSMFNLARSSQAQGGPWRAWQIGVRESGFPLDRVEAQRKEYHQLFGKEAGDSLIEQEYFVSFDAAILGSYWGKELERARQQGRVRRVPIEPGYPIHRAWDLGIGDSTAIWFFQIILGEIRVVGFYQAHGVGLSHYRDVIRNDWNIIGGVDYVPHDARARELGTGKTRVETMLELKLNPEVVANHSVEDGINAGRRVLPRCWFDEEYCQEGLECLVHYRAEWDTELRCFTDKPVHDFSSHAADAFRYLAMAYEHAVGISAAPQKSAIVIPHAGTPPATQFPLPIGNLWDLKARSNNPMGY